MPDGSRLSLILYILGGTPVAHRAVSNVTALCDEVLGQGAYDLEVVDIMENPDRAEQAQILATPALIKENPPPTLRLIGDLSERDVVIEGLGLDPSLEGGP